MSAVKHLYTLLWASQVALVVENLPANAGDVKIPWRKAWQPTPVFLSEESHGQRVLVAYGPEGHRVRHD